MHSNIRPTPPVLHLFGSKEHDIAFLKEIFEIQLYFCFTTNIFVRATFQLNQPLSYAPQVILSSMIKECEIKVENRGMADAQG